MNKIYKILFKVSVSSNYYTNGICPDLTIEPTEACKKIMKNYRLFFKQTNTGLVVLYEGWPDSSTPPVVTPVIPITSDTLFSFRMVLLNNRFMQYTDLPGVANLKGRPVFRFTNNVLNTETIEIQRNVDPLPPPLIIEAPRFPFKVELDNNPSSIEISDENGSVVYTTDVRGKTAAEQAALNDDGTAMTFYEYPGLDLSKQPSGIYTVVVKRGGVVVAAFTKKIYTSAEYIQDAFGIIDIKYRWGQLADNSKHQDFQLNFNSRSINWQYIVHLRELIPPPPVAIRATVNNILINHTTLSFSPTPDPAARLVRFDSDALIKLHEVAYTKIVLNKTAPSPRVIIEQMPNPELERIDLKNNLSVMHITI